VRDRLAAAGVELPDADVAILAATQAGYAEAIELLYAADGEREQQAATVFAARA
jgi:hypothetical protein